MVNEILSQNCWRVYSNPTFSSTATTNLNEEDTVSWFSVASNFLKSQTGVSKPSSYYHLPLSQVTSQIAFILIQTFQLTSPKPTSNISWSSLKTLNNFNDLYVLLFKILCRYWWETVLSDINNDKINQEEIKYSPPTEGYISSALNVVGAAKKAAGTVVGGVGGRGKSHYINCFAGVITLVRER